MVTLSERRFVRFYLNKAAIDYQKQMYQIGIKNKQKDNSHFHKVQMSENIP